MSRSYVLIVCEVVFVAVVCMVAVILFRRPPPPVATAVNVEVKLPDSQAHVFLDRQEGRFAYLIQRSDASLERVSPEEMARRMYDDEKAEEGGLALNLHNPVLLIWLGIGLVGQVLFTGRMVVQYVASHRQGKSVVPPLFWWMSLVGSVLLLAYFLWRRDPIGLLGQAFGSFVYLKNILWIGAEARQPQSAVAA